MFIEVMSNNIIYFNIYNINNICINRTFKHMLCLYIINILNNII